MVWYILEKVNCLCIDFFLYPECVINGQRVWEGRDVRIPEEPCLSCRCVHGALSCAKRACPVLPCSRAQQHTPPGECCPRCTHPTSDKILPSKLVISYPYVKMKTLRIMVFENYWQVLTLSKQFFGNHPFKKVESSLVWRELCRKYNYTLDVIG